MEAKLMQSKACFSFHLDGSNSIDADILSRTISDVAELTKMAAQEENAEAYLKMNVTAFKDGCFQIDFSAICELAENLYNAVPECATFALTVVSIVKGFFEIKKHLKGKKAKKIESTDDKTIRVENANGDSIIVEKSSVAAINNIKIDQLLINIANDVKEHNPNGGFKMSTDNDEAVYTPEDVQCFSKTYPIEEETLCKRYRIETSLTIKKPDILGNSKWHFMFDNKTIYASIEDEEFIKKIHKGTFAIKAYDYIDVTLQIYVDLDELEKPIEDSIKYTVVKVHGDIHHQNSDSYQTSMDL